MRIVTGSLVLIGLTSCGGAPVAPRPPVDDDRVAAPQPARPPLTQLLAGPYPDLDAHAATLAASHGCDPVQPLIALDVLESKHEEQEGRCALAVQTAQGWFVGPWTSSVCLERGYIEVSDASTSEPATGVVQVDLSVYWHTNNHDDEARYQLTALCGAPAGTPRCTPLLVTSCEQGAPADGCIDRG